MAKNIERNDLVDQIFGKPGRRVIIEYIVKESDGLTVGENEQRAKDFQFVLMEFSLHGLDLGNVTVRDVDGEVVLFAVVNDNKVISGFRHPERYKPKRVKKVKKIKKKKDE